MEIIYSYIFYVLIAISSSFCALCAHKARSWTGQFIFRCLLFAVFFIPAILRFGIGTDYGNYVRIYGSNFETSLLEIGNQWIFNFCKSLNLSAWWMFALTSALTYVPVCFWISKKRIDKIILLYNLLFCYLSSYNIMRQILALSFILAGCEKYLEQKYKTSLLLFFVACLFHTSSCVIVLCLIWMKTGVRSNTARIVFTLAGTCFVFSPLMMTVLKSILTVLFPRYAGYLTDELYGAATELGSGLGVLGNIMIFFVILLNAKTFPAKYYPLLNLCTIYILGYILAGQILILGRLREALIFIPIYVFTLLPSVSRSKYRKVFYYAVLLFYALTYCKTLVSSHVGTFSAGVIPYTSIFS